MRTMWATVAAAAAAVLGVAGCGGYSSKNMSYGTPCTPAATAQVTVSSTGFEPTAVCVLPGGTVTFNNADTVAHDIESGTTCTALNLGSIPAGMSVGATLPTAAVCTFFDAAHSTNPAFEGTVAVTSSMTIGPGY